METEQPGVLQSTGSQGIRHDLATGQQQQVQHSEVKEFGKVGGRQITGRIK